MTSTEREALIEKAADAMYFEDCGVAALDDDAEPFRGMARVALAVFEEAHAPTDDEIRIATLHAVRKGAKSDAEAVRNYREAERCIRAAIPHLFRRPVQATPTDDEREELAVLISDYINETDDSADLPHTRGLAEQIIARSRSTSSTLGLVRGCARRSETRAAAKAINVAGWTAEGGEHEPGCFCGDCERVCTPVALAALRAASAVGRQGESR